MVKKPTQAALAESLSRLRRDIDAVTEALPSGARVCLLPLMEQVSATCAMAVACDRDIARLHVDELERLLGDLSQIEASMTALHAKTAGDPETEDHRSTPQSTSRASRAYGNVSALSPKRQPEDR